MRTTGSTAPTNKLTPPKVTREFTIGGERVMLLGDGRLVHVPSPVAPEASPVVQPSAEAPKRRAPYTRRELRHLHDQRAAEQDALNAQVPERSPLVLVARTVACGCGARLMVAPSWTVATCHHCRAAVELPPAVDAVVATVTS